MVPDLVRDDVGLREIAGRAEAPLELVEEREVDVDALVGRAVEGSHRRRVEAAGRLHHVREQDQVRLLVGGALLLEDAPSRCPR